MGMPRFSMPPPMCIRQLLSQAARASAPVSEAKLILSFSIAPEMSGYFTEKVPPKPQQTSDCRISTSSMPGSVFSRARGWVVSAEFAAEVTAFVVGYFSCRFGRIGVCELAEVGDAEDIYDEFGEFEGSACQRCDTIPHVRFVVE